MIPKFRGKTIKGIWVSGFVSVVTDKRVGVEPGTYISNSVGVPFAYEVIPETVGQSTGLKDKNGVEIYQDDVVNMCWSDEIGESNWGKITIKNPFDYCIEEARYLIHADELEVIGNIYENPELLEGAKQ